MKIKVSISMEDKLFKEVEKSLENTIFRNKSHFIEYATQRLLKEVKNGNKDI